MVKRVCILLVSMWVLSAILAGRAAVGPPANGAAPGSGPASGEAAIRSEPLRSTSAPRTEFLFESLSGEETGIDLVYDFPTNAPFELLQDQGCASGVCLGDYDGDGNADVFLTHYDRGNRLYRNLGNWRFEDVTRQAGLAGSGRWCAGATFVDLDNDEDLDLYVCVFNAPNLLYVNQGDGTFQEQARQRGLDFSGASVMMAFADYDRDGHLDGYLVTHRLNLGTDHRLPRNSEAAFRRAIVRATGRSQIEVGPAYRELFATIGKGAGRTELIIAGQQDYLYHNDGQGRFTNVNAAAGIQGNDIGLAANWWDFDDDGFPDLYVSNDYKGPDRLYRNNRDGTFTDVARTALPHVPWSSMGADLADIDNDGRMDFMATEMAGSTHFRRMTINGDLPKERWFLVTSEPRQYQRNAVYLGTGTGHVLEVAHLTGLAGTDWTWSPKFADLDNDGWVDLFIGNGMSRDFVNSDLLGQMRDRGSRNWLAMPVLREANLAFRNLGDLQFASVGKSWGLDHVSASFGAAFGDLDRDGDLDLIVNNFNEPVSVYRNRSEAGHRVVLRLKGTRSNSWGIGAKVQLTTPAGVQTRYLSLTSGILSANEPLLHFGLGQSKRIAQLRIEWPSGWSQTLGPLDGDRFYTITEPSDPPPGLRSREAPAGWFRRAEPTERRRHHERSFDDFGREPLLPWALSQLGPGLAVGDVDGDGDEDAYLGGAAGQAGFLCLNDGRGRFQLSTQPCFEQDQAAEDMAALFFDADADGDPDLYVVSGGVECEPGDTVLRDRLYLNVGHGQFTRAPDPALPDLRDSGSSVATADFDRDGDLDLFVGSRCVPGRYPQTPESRLLRNDRGRFTDATDALAPGLRTTGLVTSAVWSDADGDGWLDLLVTHEWGPVKLFRNARGQFVDRTREAGLEARTGWWNGLAVRDLDGDGDLDYVVTNFGLNSKYHASERRPALAFVVPILDEPQLIEAAFEGDTLYPVRGRDEFLGFYPALVERFPSYRSFATASLEELLTAELLRASQRLEVNTLESGILFNDGNARFTFVPLPRRVQVAPAFGVVASELDGDGQPDLYLAHNFSGPQPETGRMAGGLSQLLAGRADGSFALVEPSTSGLLVPGDARSVALSDLNGDGRPDLLLGLNDSELQVFTNATPPGHRILTVRLRGATGNPSAIGARVTATLTDGSRQGAEVQGGGGYLSQSTPALFFGLGATNRVRELAVRWPDGTTTTTNVAAAALAVVLPQTQALQARPTFRP